MSKWQTELAGKAWNSLYWSNHDQPRALSRFGCVNEPYRERCAKMLATCLHMLQGTPYIYQGEELGMTGAHFTKLSQYRDVESLNLFRELTESGRMTPDAMLRCMAARSRDNARTPMQWDASSQAGFTTGTPWLAVNPNYREINAGEQTRRADSVWNHYRRLIALRREMDIIVYGAYRLLTPEDDEAVWVYERSLGDKRLLVRCNFTDGEVACAAPADSLGDVLVTNVASPSSDALQPYEATVYYCDLAGLDGL